MQEQQMTVETALRLIDQVCAQYQGSRADHINLQVAVETIRKELPLNEKTQDNEEDNLPAVDEDQRYDNASKSDN